MQKSYLDKKIQGRLNSYSTMLAAYNAGKLSETQQNTLIKLSSLIIQDLVGSQIKSKKQSLMDGENIFQQQIKGDK